jgi:hypothetical protein
MTSSRLSLEKKMPANVPQPPARDSVELAYLRKDRYQSERCRNRLASRRPSRNSQIRHLILGVTVSTREVESTTQSTFALIFAPGCVFRSVVFLLWSL